MQYIGKIISGSGGAGPAFRYENYRRCKEINKTLGIEVMPGTLNIKLDSGFDWGCSHIECSLLELNKGDKKPDLNGEWSLKTCSFYKLKLIVNNKEFSVYAMRFNEDMNRYPNNFLELISEHHLRVEAGIRNGDNVLLMED